MTETIEDYNVAILRGINVSGKNMIKMPALTNMLKEIGFHSVKTYLQSGNVIFKSQSTKPEDFAKQISDRIQKEFGLKVPVIVISGSYLQKVRDSNPFVKRNDIDLTKLHVTFLSEEPASENESKINAEQYLPDEFVVEKRTVYLHCPGSYGETKLNNNFFENKLKVTATTRNWKTVNALVELVHGKN